MKRFLMKTDEWLRRRLRMCIWKSWKRVKTRVANLVKCGIDKYQAYMWGNSRLGYWRIAGSYILSRAITNEKLSMAGYATLMGSYIEWHPKQEPPYAEPHVRWCGRSENESRRNPTSFSSYSIIRIALDDIEM